MKNSQGFTLIEIMIVFGIIAVIGVTASLNLFGKKSTVSLQSTAQTIGAVLREAQSDSMAQSNKAQWGVHFDNTATSSPFFQLFYTTDGAYDASSTISGRYALPGSVCFDASSVPAGSSTDIIFNSISGAASASATIMLDYVTGPCPSATSSVAGSITRTASGKIFFDDFNRTNL